MTLTKILMLVSQSFIIVTKLLDEMAPYKKLTKREIRLQHKPWITSGILISMAKRDIFYKDFITEKYPIKKERLGSINHIETLLYLFSGKAKENTIQNISKNTKII